MYNPGDKIVCIENKHPSGYIIKELELYKTYNVTTRSEYFFKYKSPYSNVSGVYPMCLFISLLEYRKLKLNKLKELCKKVKS